MGCGLSFPKVPLSRDKVVVVTGGNTGIGYENAKWLAMMGAHVIIACRSEERALKAIDNMNKDFQEEKARGTEGITDADSLDVQFMKLDCASLKSTEDFISEFKAKESRLHLLILNAGITTYGLEYTEDNFESMFHVNYLSQVLLSIKLLPTMMRSGDDCRVIFISSYAHNWGEVDVETIQARQFTTENFDKMKYYGNSKLFQVMLMYSLNERISSSNVVVNSVHPGLVDTELVRDYEQKMGCFHCIKACLKCCCCCLYWSPYKGSTTQTNAAINPKYKGVRDVYFASCKPKTPNSKARNKAKQQELWDYSMECLKEHITEADLQALGNAQTDINVQLSDN